MVRPAAMALVLVVILANAASVSHFNDGPATVPREPGNTMLSRFLRGAAVVLTVPFPAAGMADLRAVLLPAGLGGLLAILGFASLRGSLRTAAAPTGQLPPTSGSGREASRPEAWLSLIGASVIVLALCSMLANRSRELSWGWLTLLSAGVGWAAIIARSFDERMARFALAGILGTATVCMLLAVADRAERGLAHFTWPIGPITVTASMAAVWGALTLAWAGHQLVTERRLSMGAASCLLIAGLSCYVLTETGRRASIVGLIAGLTGAVGLSVWFATKRRTARALLVMGGLAVAATCAAFLIREATSERREVSGPVRLRLEFWRISSELIPRQPLLGIGPGMFVVAMTNAVAPLRAESPHVYHGHLDPYAHNEWLQAVVELGLPGGLLYAALPLGAAIWAIRRSARHPGRSIASVQFAAASGILVIFVSELAAITLRSPILPVLYWTLIGLACIPPNGGGIARSVRRLASALPLALAGVCWVICIGDIRAAGAEVRDQPDVGRRPDSRLYPEMTIRAWTQAAARCLDTALSRRTAPELNTAVARWRELYEQIPGYSGVAASYAEALMAAARYDEAREVLRRTIEDGIEPYNPEINEFYARLPGLDALGRFRCIQRGLRGGALRDLSSRLLSDCLRDGEVQSLFQSEAALAREVVSQRRQSCADGMLPEILRMASANALARGRFEEAVADQRRAAEYYAWLEERSDPHRRVSDAEWDAWYRLALMYYNGDRGNYRTALQAMFAAERFAALSIRHERVAHPQPELGFVIGEVMPVEFPEKLRPLWRLSFLLHLLNGDLSEPEIRAGLTLSPPQRTNQAIAGEIERAARQVLRQLEVDPAPDHPANMDQLRQLADHFGRVAHDQKPHGTVP